MQYIFDMTVHVDNITARKYSWETGSTNVFNRWIQIELIQMYLFMLVMFV